MSLINITQTLQFDTELPVWKQTPEVQEYVSELMTNEPDSEEKEPCLNGFERVIRREWVTGTASKIIEGTIYNEPATSREFMGINNIIITLEHGA